MKKRRAAGPEEKTKQQRARYLGHTLSETNVPQWNHRDEGNGDDSLPKNAPCTCVVFAG